MKDIFDTIAFYVGYTVLYILIGLIVLLLLIKIQDILDKISYKIWLKKRKKESEE